LDTDRAEQHVRSTSSENSVEEDLKDSKLQKYRVSQAVRPSRSKFGKHARTNLGRQELPTPTPRALKKDLEVVSTLQKKGDVLTAKIDASRQSGFNLKRRRRRRTSSLCDDGIELVVSPRATDEEGASLTKERSDDGKVQVVSSDDVRKSEAESEAADERRKSASCSRPKSVREKAASQP
jgi:hypothetical protein